MLWYIRKTYNYLGLNTFLTDVEIINRQLQLVMVLKTCHKSALCPRHTSAVTLDAILASDCKMEHICNYSWASQLFTRSGDIDRAHHAMSLILSHPVGPRVAPADRNTAAVIRGILAEKIKIIDETD